MGINKLQWVTKFYNELERKILITLLRNFELSEREYESFKKKIKKIIYEHKETEFKEPIVWNGTQKEFAELVLELQKKGWIATDGERSIANLSKEFASSFDLSGTKKSKNSNEENSFYQLLKPQQNKENGYENIYPQIYTKRYKPCFQEIKERVKKKI